MPLCLSYRGVSVKVIRNLLAPKIGNLAKNCGIARSMLQCNNIGGLPPAYAIEQLLPMLLSNY
jgi:hypothetical protein